MKKLNKFVKFVKQDPMLVLVYLLAIMLFTQQYWLSGGAFLAIAICATDAGND